MVNMMVHSMVSIVVNVTVHATVSVMINAMINVVVVLRLMRGSCDGCTVADLIAGALICFQIGVLFALFSANTLIF
jgi:hypothetical protein